MALQLILGGSGSGKSTFLYKKIIEESMENPEKNYFVIVPEQYTMAIQKRIVELHPRKGILNIDVISFQRLAFKVFEEVGASDYPVLDDTGKNLIVRRILEQNKGKLKFFGENISNTGFVSEMKSIISEMLQYDISTDKLEKVSREADSDSILNMKLEDINLIYKNFKAFINNNYITAEEILDVFCKKVNESSMLKNSVLAFDAFTGFTPVQYRLFGELLSMCDMVYVALTLDSKENVNVVSGVEELFYLTKDSVSKLYRICDDKHIDIINPVKIEDDINSRFKNSKELLFLEKNLFRNNNKKYPDNVEDIVLYEGITPKDELNYVVGEILELTHKKGYRYNQIGVVTADIETYGKLLGNLFAQNDIPYFLDRKCHITDNPLIEMINGVLEVIETNYSYDSMFRYLRTGMTDLSTEEIDILDNYCLAVGIRGSKSWNSEWTRKFRKRNNKTDLVMLNELRLKVVTPISQLEQVVKESDGCVETITRALYQFMCTMKCSQHINAMADQDVAGEEYGQVYKKTIEVLDLIVKLLGSEKVTLKEYNRILASGFEEIKIGLIPPSNDCIVIGDMERTRLDNVRVIFFVGVNDGHVPKKNDSKSILSETDRDKLEKMDVSLTMSPRQSAFVQRFYLYLIMTKTEEKLYISYSRNGLDMKSILPSYLIRVIRKMFPRIKINTGKDTLLKHSYLRIPKAGLVWSEENASKMLAEGIALLLYGTELKGSVTSFEQFSSCKYAYFFRYGLGLDEREEFKFAVNDFGTIMHAVIEKVSATVKDKKLSYSLITDEERRTLVSDSVNYIAENYGNTILMDSSRNEFMIKRITDIADKTIWAIGKQLENGLFYPDMFEEKFLIDVGELPEDVHFLMEGKIDRVDICEDENNLYVRVVDYKTGNNDVKVSDIYYGLKIQLLTYLKAAIEREKKLHPDKNVVPAGILYYNVDDPIVEVSEGSQEEIDTLVRKELRMKGYVNSDKEIIRLMDDTEGSSFNIPVTKTSKGEISQSKSRTMSTEELEELSRFVGDKSLSIARRIIEGDISIDPYSSGSYNSCKYCTYKEACCFSTDMPGYKYRILPSMNNEEVWEKIRKGVKDNGKDMD